MHHDQILFLARLAHFDICPVIYFDFFRLYVLVCFFSYIGGIVPGQNFCLSPYTARWSQSGHFPAGSFFEFDGKKWPGWHHAENDTTGTRLDRRYFSWVYIIFPIYWIDPIYPICSIYCITIFYYFLPFRTTSHYLILFRIILGISTKFGTTERSPRKTYNIYFFLIQRRCLRPPLPVKRGRGVG